MFFLSHCCQSPFLAGSHSPPHLPRMPSNTVLISGPAGGQLRVWPGPAPTCSCPQCPQPAELVHFLLRAFSVPFMFPQTQRPPRSSCGFNLQPVQLVGRFGVFFLSHTAPGFQLWFYFHLCMWVVPWGLLLRLPWRTWVRPWGPSVKVGQCLGRRGSGSTRYSGGWRLGRQEI